MYFNKSKCTGELKVAQITMLISFNISYAAMKPHITELAGLFAHELDVNTSQVRKLLLYCMNICCLIIYSSSINNFNKVKKCLIKNIRVHGVVNMG